MKTHFLKAILFTGLLIGSLGFSSCKGKETETTTEASDTIPEEGMSSVPVADTVVKDNDTIVDMGDNGGNSVKENPVGTQVP
ncbi:hypothetical protein ACLI09_12105 [Flavobacterium sp. RHBU_24]|uniref:hypothetical protein n=1 Tax=Flavobacterium sp. RHBU_24 TaxID=3391185 RepID=UPI0039848D52